MALTKIPANLLDKSSNLDFADGEEIRIGTGNDLRIFHAGTENFIRGNATESPLYIDVCQNLHIRHLDTDGGNAETMIKGIGDGAVELYHNNVKKFETTSGGVSLTGQLNLTGNAVFNTASKIIFGGDDTYNAHLQYTDNGSGDHFLSIKTEHDNTITERARFHAGTGAITFTGNTTFSNDLTVGGDLNITGDINSVSVTDLDVTDKTITVAKGSANASAANGAGIVVDGASASLTYNNTGDGWVFNKSLGIGSGSASYRLDVETSSSDIARLTRTGSSSYLWQISDAGTGAAQLWTSAQTNDTGFLFRPKNSSGSNVNALFIAPDGQILMNLTGSDVGASTNILEASGNFRLSGGNRTIKFNNGSHEIVGIAQIASNKMQYASGRMTIDVGNSKVGIGNNGPSSKLHVRGTQSDTMTAANAYAAFDGAGGDGLIIGSRATTPYAAYIQSGYTPNIGTSHHYPLALNPHGGNVGIGTVTPGVELDIKRTANSYPLRIGSDGGAGRAMVFADMASSASKYNWLIGAQYNIDNGFEITASTAVGGYTFNSPSMVFTNTGKVGIGTNTPQNNHSKANNLVVGSGSAGGMAVFNGTSEGWYAFSRGNANNTDAYDGGMSYNGDRILKFHTNAGSTRAQIDASGHFKPGSDNAYDLGSTSLRWRNLYTTDLHLSNEGSQNDVDGTSGNWTIQEGEEHLFIINNKNGKKYKFALEEIE